MIEQRREDGSLRHLISLQGLRREGIEGLLQRSLQFVREAGDRPYRSRALAGVQIANLFTEPSTRTRVSFELAGKRLGADVVNLEVDVIAKYVERLLAGSGEANE